MGWSGGSVVLGKLPGCPTVWMIVGQGPITLAVGAGGELLGHFFSHLSFLSSPLFFTLLYSFYSPLFFLSSFSLSGRRSDID